jgi:alcohol dehydrogenase class IV
MINGTFGTGTLEGRTPLKAEFTPNPVGKIILGPGCVGERLASEVKALGGRRPLLVTGTALATQTDLVERVAGALGGSLVGLFSGAKQHNPRSSVLAGAAIAREAGADLLISLGGGSHIDCAKGIALVLAEGEDFERLRVRPVPRPKLPHIAITTTLSAGEFTGVVGITDEGRKEFFTDPGLAPRVVFLDPEMTLETPLWLWASTGIEALDHCVERMYSRLSQPYTEALCLHGIRLIFGNLRPSVERPTDLYHRSQLQVAAWLSEYGPSAGCISHAIGHQLGARCGVPQGICSCIVLPLAMEFNRPFSAEKQALMAQAMGINTARMGEDKAAEAAARAVKELVGSLGLPRRLKEVGVREGELRPVAEAVMEQGILANPRPVRDTEEVLELLKLAW